MAKKSNMKDLSSVDQALDWIYSFTNLEIQRDPHIFLNESKLKKIIYLLENLNNPHKTFNSIHIAGSKGKGSNAYIISSYFLNKRYKTGLYISPHMIRPNERIQINHVSISDDDFVKLANIVKPIVDKNKDKELQPTFFDIFTAMAFLYFSIKKVDIAVIETGLGGRLDSTNVLNPVCCVITSISKEHTEILGKTIKSITFEKSGIIKEQTPVVLGYNSFEVRQLIKKTCLQKKAPYYYAPLFYYSKIKKYVQNGAIINSMIRIENLKTNESIFVKSRLLGMFQNENIATALTAIDVYEKVQGNSSDLFIMNQVITDFEWHGRCQSFNYKNIPVIIDGAHNDDSAKKLLITLQQLQNSRIVKKNGLFIVGIMKDKDHTSILKEFYKKMKAVVFIEADQWKDSKVSNYSSIFEKINKKRIPYKMYDYFIDDFKKIIDDALLFSQNSGINPDFIVISGSLYASAMALRFFIQNISSA